MPPSIADRAAKTQYRGKEGLAIGNGYSKRGGAKIPLTDTQKRNRDKWVLESQERRSASAARTISRAVSHSTSISSPSSSILELPLTTSSPSLVGSDQDDAHSTYSVPPVSDIDLDYGSSQSNRSTPFMFPDSDEKEVDEDVVHPAKKQRLSEDKYLSIIGREELFKDSDGGNGTRSRTRST